VGKSRISLDLGVQQYEDGMTPEDMVRAYDTLVRADDHVILFLADRRHLEAVERLFLRSAG